MLSLRTDQRCLRATGYILALAAICNGSAYSENPPNIVLMMADDLGFSDLGCYGSEIPTPNLDRLANHGVVFSNFSNTSRCCPSRASLLTGLYSHAAGIGDMNYSDKGPGYRGQLLTEVTTLPELLKHSGYSTWMVGKWHLTRSGTIDDGPNGSWPTQRGFDRFYGTMEGAKNYFRPTWFFDHVEKITSFQNGFYYTNAISQRAADWIRNQPTDRPIFLYTAFYAPHFPLQAPREAIARHRGKYLTGWDQLRERRISKQKSVGMIDRNVELSARPADVPSWDSLSQQQKDELDLRMATYAAQVELLDAGVGRIVDALTTTGRLDNTLIVFLSDNGAASSGGAMGAGPISKVGTPEAPVKTTYGKGWATLSNTPFRMHKANTHEGGVMAPLIIHWPARLGQEKKMRHDLGHIVDITPTLLAAGRADNNKQVFAGIDLLNDSRGAESPIFYEHQKSRAVRLDDYKLVNRNKSNEWELYNLAEDRTESNNISASYPDIMLHLHNLWFEWAKAHNVKLP